LEFEIVHPFHPDRGRRLTKVHARIDRGVEWLWYMDGQGRARQVQRALTNFAQSDAFLHEAAGRCAFHLRDLVVLVGVLERLRRRLSAPAQG